MATNKSTRKPVKKSASASTKKSSKSFKVNYQKPGDMPAQETVKSGATLGDFITDHNLEGYDVFLNGGKPSNSTELSKDDTIRVGVKTKNA